jgi:hypothetical protein
MLQKAYARSAHVGAFFEAPPGRPQDEGALGSYARPEKAAQPLEKVDFAEQIDLVWFSLFLAWILYQFSLDFVAAAFESVAPGLDFVASKARK